MMNIAIKLATLSVLAMSAIAAQGAERHVTGGIVRGDDLPDDSVIFRSIPFAAPPLGNLRWKPPQPVIPWQGIREAQTVGRPCAQLVEGWNAADAPISSEDCLYLSVHEPKHAADEKLPVYVWIHGGSNRAGTGHDVGESPIYKHGIVLVSIEYRLGVFGFLASAELTAESPHHSSGNYALLDQIAALKWVKENITAFGGDPNNVTVGGQSAGAIDVGQLMRSPLAAGLFNKAIQESGALAPPRSAEENEKVGHDLLMKLKIPADKYALATLRKLPTALLLTESETLTPPSGDHNHVWMETSADGWVIPKGRNDLYKDDNAFHVPHILGTITQEFIFDGDADAARALVPKIYGTSSGAALKLYGFIEPQSTDDEIFGSVGTQVLTDWMFRCPSYQQAKWEITAHQKVWRYEFGIPRPGHTRIEHNAELDYAYYPVPAAATSQTWPPLQQYWANFIKSGDPNGNSLTHWSDMGTSANTIVFLPTGINIGKDIHGNQCRLLAEKNANP